MHAALIKRRAANLAPAGNGRGFNWYREGLEGAAQANAGIAPNGTNTARKIVADTRQVWHQIQAFCPDDAPYTEVGQPYTFSVFVKSAGWRYARIDYQWYYTPHILTLDLLTGTYTMPPAGSPIRPRAYRVETLPDGWYRVSITEVNSRDRDMYPNVSFVDAAGNTNVPGDGTSGILLWGYQVNTGGPAPYNPALPPA